MIESIHYVIKLNLKSVEDARDYLRQHKNMSLVIRLNNQNDYDLLVEGIFKMRGMKGIKLINGLENPRIYHFKR